MKVKIAYRLVRLAAWLDPDGESVKHYARAVNDYCEKVYGRRSYNK